MHDDCFLPVADTLPRENTVLCFILFGSFCSSNNFYFHFGGIDHLFLSFSIAVMNVSLRLLMPLLLFTALLYILCSLFIFTVRCSYASAVLGVIILSFCHMRAL